MGKIYHKTLVISILVLILALFVPTAGAGIQKLDALASIFAMRPVTVECKTPAEDAILHTAWGYVWLGSNYMTLDNSLCKAMVSPDESSDWILGGSIIVIIHESYHLRNWDLQHNEAAVECRAIRHFKVGAKLLGLSEKRIERIFPWALTFHWRLVTKFPEYFQKSCKVPNPW